MAAGSSQCREFLVESRHNQLIRVTGYFMNQAAEALLIEFRGGIIEQ